MEVALHTERSPEAVARSASALSLPGGLAKEWNLLDTGREHTRAISSMASGSTQRITLQCLALNPELSNPKRSPAKYRRKLSSGQSRWPPASGAASPTPNTQVRKRVWWRA